MNYYLIILLGIIIIVYLEKNRRSIKIINEDLYNLHERFSNLEDAQEISYMVPYEKDGKKGKKKLTKKMYEDDKDIIYQEEGDHKIYHSKK